MSLLQLNSEFASGLVLQKLADRQSLKLRELSIANVRPVWELCHGYLWQWSLCSRVMKLAMLMWLRQRGWARALCSSHGWLAAWYSPCAGAPAWPGPWAPGPRSSGPESPDNGLSVFSTPVSPQTMKAAKKQRKRTIRYFLPRSNEPCVSVCWRMIFKLQKYQYYQAYCQWWPCILKLMLQSYLHIFVLWGGFLVHKFVTECFSSFLLFVYFYWNPLNGIINCQNGPLDLVVCEERRRPFPFCTSHSVQR